MNNFFNSPSMKYRRAEAGITLIEVSIGLIIAAIIAAAAFIAFQNNSRRQEVRENISAITEIASEARNKFIKTGQGALLDNAAADSANLFEPIGGQSNSYGGAVTFTAAAPGATPPTPARLTWNDVDADQCVDLALALRENFSTVRINATDVTITTSVANIDTACNNAPADFRFDL